MTNKLLIKNILLGSLSWFIPFAFSFLFYEPGGQLLVPYATFKSVIMVIGILSGCFLLHHYFRYIDGDFVKNSIIIGLSWLAINIVLDSVILIPIMKTTFSNYFISIGLSYFSIPIISTTIGFALNTKLKKV